MDDALKYPKTGFVIYQYGFQNWNRLSPLYGALNAPPFCLGRMREWAMQSKRDGLIPIGEALADLRGPVKAIREDSPQARHHFTQAEQVNRLVTARESDPDLGFQARMMALCSLPRSNPGQRKEYVRRNGPYTLGMSAGIGNKLPFGTLPRLLMAWVSTEAVKTQSPVLVLGNSLTEFMNKLGINSDSSGRRGERTRLRNQMDRLFNSTVQFIYEPKAPDGASLGVKDTFNSTVARKTHLVWNPKKPNEPVLWESTVELGHDFFHDILRHPFPLDMNILKALKKSPLGLDFYMWAVYRTFSLTRPIRLSWPHLYRQFGADPSRASDKRTVDAFRTDCLRELKKIKTAWPELNYALGKGVLVLGPSEPSIPRNDP